MCSVRMLIWSADKYCNNSSSLLYSETPLMHPLEQAYMTALGTGGS